MVNSRWPLFAKFWKNEFWLFSKRQTRREKRHVMMAYSEWPTFAKISLEFFPSAKQSEKRVVS